MIDILAQSMLNAIGFRGDHPVAQRNRDRIANDITPDSQPARLRPPKAAYRRHHTSRSECGNDL